MDYSIDWLISLIAEYKNKYLKSPLFISDWNSIYGSTKSPSSLIKSALDLSIDSYDYVYASEQWSIKNRIVSDFLLNNKTGLGNISTENIGLAITISPTASIYLTLKILLKKGVKRFLVITPTYHSILYTLKDLNASIIYFHLEDDTAFNIDTYEIQKILLQQDIEAVILCDPIYSCGIEVTPDLYNNLVSICSINGIWLIVDYALGGLEWDHINRSQNGLIKIGIACSYDKFVFIESTAKKLQINGLKSSIVLTNKELAAKIEEISTKVYGGFSLPQIILLGEFYSSSNTNTVSEIIIKNVEIIRSNYDLLKKLLFDTEFELYAANSGNFTMIVHKKYKIKEVNSKAIIRSYLFDEDVLAFPTFQYALYEENKFGFRVNLLQDISKFINPLQKCIMKDMILLR